MEVFIGAYDWVGLAGAFRLSLTGVTPSLAAPAVVEYDQKVF